VSTHFALVAFVVVLALIWLATPTGRGR